MQFFTGIPKAGDIAWDSPVNEGIPMPSAPLLDSEKGGVQETRRALCVPGRPSGGPTAAARLTGGWVSALKAEPRRADTALRTVRVTRPRTGRFWTCGEGAPLSQRCDLQSVQELLLRLPLRQEMEKRAVLNKHTHTQNLHSAAVEVRHERVLDVMSVRTCREMEGVSEECFSFDSFACPVSHLAAGFTCATLFWQGEKNAGFDVLYHNMKHGQLATKELAEFVRERAAIEETYSKSMSKLAKMASNGSPLGTFAPMWDVFRVSSDKLALCHLELMRKMNSLIADVNKYGDEQVKVHRKKCRETYSGRCAELERLRREGAPQKEMEKAELKSKKAAESLSSCVEKYNRVGSDFEQKMLESAQVHEEFKQNVENIGIENLIKKFAEQKGTGKERPAPVGFEDCSSSLVSDGGKRVRSKAFRIPGLGKRDKEPDSTSLLSFAHVQNSPEVDEEGFVIRADVNHNDILSSHADKDASFFSSDSDFDDDEPKKFRIQIRPVGAGAGRRNPPADERELRATVGALTLPPNRAVHSFGEAEGLRRSVSSPDHSRLRSTASASESLFGPPLESALKSSRFAGTVVFASLPWQLPDAAFSSNSSSPENVEDSGLDSPSHQPLGPSPEPNGWAAWPVAPQSREPVNLSRPSDPFLTVFRDPSPARVPVQPDDPAGIWAPPTRCPRAAPDMDPTFPNFPAFGTPPAARRDSAELLAVAPTRPSRSKRTHGGRQGGCERSRSLCSSPLPGPSPTLTTSSSSSSSPSDWGGQTSTPRAPSPARGLSRGPSPITLSTQESWPVAAAITEYINAYFKGGEHNRCLVKITGDLTMSFPAGITRIFTANPNAPVLSFRLVNTGRRPLAERSRHQGLLLSSQDPGCAPLLLSAECQRSGTVTRVSLDYHCCPVTAPSAQLTNVQVLLPLDHTATDLQCQPPAAWNPEERRLLWKLSSLCPTNHSKGSGTLCASWQCLEVPRGPPPSLVVQFVGSGASLSGLDVELVGNRYRIPVCAVCFVNSVCL
ncbi:F-BAR domain only protein 1-like [Scleropages formosus]|uniref:F-BAR domain only protein 1-like n=1 Tax=Scleropages formosus TaxID=113540 RepID=A0A0P7W835_SCLFO|nr:F-BAR domain only protein 1-like [Scleropages formosus]